MKLKIVLLFSFFTICPIVLMVQANSQVKGIPADSVEHVKLVNASATVLNAKDSTMVSFTYAAPDGSFSIHGLHKGKFILLLSYPQYADYVEKFSVDSLNREHDFGNINMQ